MLLLLFTNATCCPESDQGTSRNLDATINQDANAILAQITTVVR